MMTDDIAAILTRHMPTVLIQNVIDCLVDRNNATVHKYWECTNDNVMTIYDKLYHEFRWTPNISNPEMIKKALIDISKEKPLRRGDMVDFDFNSYRNYFKLIFNGKTLEPLCTEVNMYGGLPDWCVFPEFPARYWWNALDNYCNEVIRIKPDDEFIANINGNQTFVKGEKIIFNCRVCIENFTWFAEIRDDHILIEDCSCNITC